MGKILLLLLLISTPAMGSEQYFAQVDAGGVVLQVVVVNSEVMSDQNGVVQEGLGVAFLQRLFGEDKTWVQTWQDGSQEPSATPRLNYAAVGYRYSQQMNAFIAPKPYPSWVLNSTTAVWEAPVPMPQDGAKYSWDEATLSWKVIN